MIKYIGVNDHKVELFEGQYKVPNGMSYNSYLLLDEKIAIMDTVDIHFSDEWIKNIQKELKGKNPDYLVILHMEPDHSASIENFLNIYPNTIVVGNVKTFPMIQQFFPELILNHKLEVKEGEILDLGTIKLKFLFAPMVHWPEVMLAYDITNKVLFSADAFGKFGALDVKEDWKEEARRYYIGIVGKYGVPVQTLFKKVAGVQIEAIYPLHGPILKENLKYYLDLYQIWSSYQPETKGVCIAYASIYGNTKQAIEKIIKELGDYSYEVFDLARCDMSLAISKAFQYEKLLIASPTYNGGVFPPVETFLHGLIERGYQKRTIGIIENGSWVPTAKKYIQQYFEKSKEISFIGDGVTIKSSLKQETLLQLKQLANQLKES